MPCWIVAGFNHWPVGDSLYGGHEDSVWRRSCTHSQRPSQTGKQSIFVTKPSHRSVQKDYLFFLFVCFGQQDLKSLSFWKITARIYTLVESDNSRFKTEHQAANLPVLLAAQSAVLDRGLQIAGLSWSDDLPPRRVRIFSPRLLSKSEPSMCRPLHKMGGGVNDLHCYATHSRGVLKPRNSWLQQSVHHFISGHEDEQLDSRWDPGDAASPRSL